MAGKQLNSKKHFWEILVLGIPGIVENLDAMSTPLASLILTGPSSPHFSNYSGQTNL